MTSIQQLKQQEALLLQEYEFEKKEYEDLCRQAGIVRRIRQGKCWFPLSVGRAFYNAFDQLVVEVENLLPSIGATSKPTTNQSNTTKSPEASSPEPQEPQEHEFEPGRPVSFFHITPAEEGGGNIPHFLPFSCQVSRVGDNRMQITLPSSGAVESLREYALRGLLGVQTAFDATSFRVMREALHMMQNTEDKRLIHLRETLIGNEKPTFRAPQPIRFPWLNTSQEEAVQTVLAAREVAIVHGPPGTGKTTTLVEAIDETLKREAQVLVSAQSNAAVDWICEQLMARGIQVLRIGNPMRVSDALLSATYERRFEGHPDYIELWAIRKELRTLYGVSRKNMSRSKLSAHEERIGKLRTRAAELEIRIDRDIFDHARVIACTLIGSASKVLERKHFPTLFIDEAAQALEPACWAAINKAERVIFAGDHKQLPPTIKCREAERGGFGRTLMEKIVHRLPECVRLLSTQYRMHRDIMSFSGAWFYGGRLQAAPAVADRTILPMEYPLVWLDTAALGLEEEENPVSQSRLNSAEATLLIRTLINYVSRVGVERILDERIDFGVISPYKSQVQLLRKLIKKSQELAPVRHLISINTVDGFQGQERDVILISMVRGNDEGRIGFLGDLRRMNVAITRAKMKLFIIGDSSTLSKTSFYQRLVSHVEKHGLLQTLQEG